MRKVLNIIKYIVISFLILLALIFAWILVQSQTSPNKVPSVFGYKPFIVLSGSMESELYKGDLAIVKNVDVETLKKNDIIAFRTHDNYVVTQRIVKIENGNFITRGDNSSEDPGEVSSLEIEGLYVYKFSGLGNVFLVLQEPSTLIVIIAIIVMGGITWMTFDNSKLSKEERNELEQLRNEKHKKRGKKKV